MSGEHDEIALKALSVTVDVSLIPYSGGKLLAMSCVRVVATFPPVIMAFLRKSHTKIICITGNVA